MDIYQATYDAVRGSISGGDIGSAVERVARDAFDVSHITSWLGQEFGTAAMEMGRPAVVFKPTLSLDGNQYCALLGDDLMSGVAGFGDTAAAAFDDFDKNFLNQKAPQQA